MKDFTDLLIWATSQIGREFFDFPVHHLGDEVYRERVYCYELYHLLRSRWPNSKYQINGEVDKRNHPYFTERGWIKPDLLVHVPRTSENYAVIEVKTSNATKAGLIEDLQHLDIFLTKIECPYDRAIMLIFGNDASKKSRSIESYKSAGHIEVWIHESAGKAAELTKTFLLE